ncbi:hypothetical protein ACF08W_29295 [Streptomyces sp. NPDC015144]|uniref:hypothetical protein n=1 Tax=Streptomyces sp. NPDC015144 TaxID=3364944 RepID=UPI0036F588C0
MQRFPRLGRILARRPRPASLLAAGTAVIILGAMGAIGASDATPADFAPKSDTVTAYNDGFIDGRADAMGDDNRDGRIDEDESGWDCRTMGNRECGPDAPTPCQKAGPALPLCVAVAMRPAYGWTNPDGSRVDVPDGRTVVRDLDAKPGSRAFLLELRALDAEYREHAPRG